MWCGDNSPDTTVHPPSSSLPSGRPLQTALKRNMNARDATTGDKLCAVPKGKKKRAPRKNKAVRFARQGKPRAIPVMNDRKRSEASVSAVRQVKCACGKTCEDQVTDAEIGALRSSIWDKNTKQQNVLIMQQMTKAGLACAPPAPQDSSPDQSTDPMALEFKHRCYIAGKLVRQRHAPIAMHSKRARLMVQTALEVLTNRFEK